MNRKMPKAARRKIRALENRHFDAEHDLVDAALDWITDHTPLTHELAAGGCAESSAFLAAVDRYFATFDELDRAETDTEFRSIIGAMSPAAPAAGTADPGDDTRPPGEPA